MEILWQRIRQLEAEIASELREKKQYLSYQRIATNRKAIRTMKRWMGIR